MRKKLSKCAHRNNTTIIIKYDVGLLSNYKYLGNLMLLTILNIHSLFIL